MARINLRNHLLEMGFSNISCFCHGRELKASIRKRAYDLLVMDFHLGDNKNGVEVIQELQKAGVLNYSTCIIFITSDRLPMIVGQIVDVHPDALVLKPYTIHSLKRTVGASLDFHFCVRPILQLMDQGDFGKALFRLDEVIRDNQNPRFSSNLLKLRARLLIKLEQYEQAISLYKDVLKSSNSIIWAKWGLIQASAMAGETENSQQMLEEMVGSHLTNDKACEWLTRIHIQKKDYQRAEEYIAKVKESELSLPAARLKASLFQTQEKLDKAKDLIERKRQSNAHIRERYSELSLDLARCYLIDAENKGANQRNKALKVARTLIGAAGQKTQDPSLQQKRDYMSCIAALIDGDQEKAKEILNRGEMTNLDNSDISTMTDAVIAWQSIGDPARASEIFHEAEQKLKTVEDENEKTINNMMLLKCEESIGDSKERSIRFNKMGMDLYVKNDFSQAIDYFYQAYILFSDEPAFSLNLLQSLVEAEKAKHKKTKTLDLFSQLSEQQLSDGNRLRLDEIANKISQSQQSFML